jgi:Transglutaminase-like superfamily
MGKKVTILLLTMMVLTGLSGWYVVGGIQAYSRYQQSSIASQEHCGGQSPVHICVQSPSEVFSSYYPYYVAIQSNLFTVHYSSSSPITLVMSVSIVGFSLVEMHTVSATPNVQTISFRPLAINQALRQLTVDDNTWLHVHISDAAGHLYYDDDSPLLLHSRWLMQWIAANRLKIAAWVTPDDSAVMALDRKAQARLPFQPQPTPPAMIGYANGASARAVRDQVDAIFDTMRLNYQIQYSQASIPYGGPGDNSVSLQKIKLPTEVLQQHSGMCIELTVLLASAVERVGLHAEIVIIPGHAFLGVAVTPNNSHFEYWDAVQVNANVAGDSANLWTDNEYLQNEKQIVDTIVISDARHQGVNPML